MIKNKIKEILVEIKDWFIYLQPISEIRYFIQRGKRGYSNRDLWSFDFYLSKLIADGLKDFKKHLHGYPAKLNSFEEWLSIIDEIIEGFEYYNEIDCGFPDKEQWDKINEKLNKSFKLLNKWFGALWD